MPLPPSLHLCPGSWWGPVVTQGEKLERDNAGADGTASDVGRALPGEFRDSGLSLSLQPQFSC